MYGWNKCAKINVKVLIILIIITAAIVASLFTARHIRRNILSEMALKAGEAAYKKEDWLAAYKNFRQYLGRNPDDVEILKKYAKASLSIRPLEVNHVSGAIAAYRRVMQIAPLDEIAYDKLAMLYAATGNYEELAYIARKRNTEVPNDRQAPLHLAEALMRLNKDTEAKTELKKVIDALKDLPERYPEYVQACVLMSQIILREDAFNAKKIALKKLNEALIYDPDSVEALICRAQFYRQMAEIPGASEEDEEDEEDRLIRLGGARRKDLEEADNLGTENPILLYSLGVEWMLLGELDLAEAELRAAESLPQEALEEHFFDLSDWAVAKFRLATELAIRRADITESASLADEVLKLLTERRHMIQVLPSAIRLYIVAGKITEARKCLDEYIDIMYTQEGQKESKLQLAYLQALVAKAEDDSYAVINVLQPAVMSDVSNPTLWRLLAEAYSRTDQTRRAISALSKYLRIRPRDAEMTKQLTKEYLKLRNWSKALQVARLAESMNPTEIILKLLRIQASINIVAEQQEEVTTAIRQALVKEVEELEKLREKHPDNVDIRILQADIANVLKDPNTAESELNEAIEQCEESLRAEMRLAMHYYRTGRIPDAINVCETACGRHSEVAEPWLSLSSIYVANKDYTEALSWLRQGLEKVVGKWEKRKVSIQLALRELLNGNEDSGIKILTEVASQDKREVHARSLLLSISAVQQDQAKVQELIGELRAAEGESGLKWRLHQATMWLSSKEWRSKQQDIDNYLQYCINSDPEWSSPVLLLGEMHEKLENFERVEDIYRQALVRNPSATDIAERLLVFLERQGRFSDAEEVFLQIEKDFRLASGWKFREAVREGDFYRAIQELEARVSSDDQDASSRILLARLIYWQDGDAVRAFDYLKQAEAIIPDSRAITAVRASILRAEGKTEEARQILDDYVASRDNFEAYWMRAVYRTEEGDLDSAEKDYIKLTTFAEEGAIGYELLSNFYANPKNKKLDKAIEVLEEGLQKYRDDLRLNLRLKRRLMKTLFLQGPTQDLQRAFEILTTLEEQLPQDPELMRLRALQLLEESTPQSRKIAREKLENVVKLEPTAVDAHLVLINIAMQEGDYETARDYAIKAIGSNPNNLPLLLARSRAEFVLGNIQMAVELAHLVLQRDSTNTGALGILLNFALEGENDSLLGDVIELARLMVEEDPNSVEVRDAFVTVSLSSKDRSLLEKARTLIESALGSNPMDEKLLISRARVLTSMELPQDAIPELKAYCQTKEGSSSIDAIVTLADLYRLAGDMEQAKQWIEQAEQIAPNSLTVIHGRFLWLVAQNRFEELAGISSVYLAAKEQNPTTLIRAASALVTLDSMTLNKEGIKLFEHAVTLLPTSSRTLRDARLGLATSLYQTGDYERAEKIYQELLKQYPNDIKILNDLAWILQEKYQRYDAALELADRALRIAPKDLYVLDTRGTILSNIPGRVTNAKDDFERLVELSAPDTPQRAKALLQLGRVCVRLNDPDQAKQHLKEALEIDQKINVFTPEELSEIARLQRIEAQTVNN